MFKRTAIAGAAALVAGGLALSSGVAQAQDSQRVEVTGSAIKRIDAETALPVTIIKREDIDKTGASNVQELIDRISSNSGGGRSLGQSVGETSATGQSGASLRGLGRERTLVLLNGRRLAAYPFSGLGIDLNAIPLAAIDRIEILRDGASSIYGSDAIGGVINFITRRDLQGGEIALGYESPEAAGGNVGSVAGAFGYGDLSRDRFNILGSFSFQKYGVIKSSQRDYAKTGNRPDLGIVSSSGNTFPANATVADPNSPFDGAYVPGAAGFPTCAPPDSFPGASNCRYDFTSKIDIVPESKRTGALLRGTFQLDTDNSLFGEFTYSKNEIIFGSSQTPSTTTGRPSYLYPGGGQFYPTAAVDAVAPGYRGPLQISWRLVDGGQRRDQVTSEQMRYVLGAEGTLLGWDYKAGAYYAESKASDDFVSGNYSDTELVRVLATGNVNPFGPNDETGIALLKEAELSGNNRKSKTSITGIDAQVSREIYNLPAGPAALALGVDTRKDKYNDGYSELAGSGDIVGGSGNAGAVSAERDITGVFGEVNVPIVKGLDVTGAVRYDRYTGTKGESRDGAFSSPDLSSTSPKFSLRWTPMKEVLFRASWGKGFRAPALDNLYAPAAGTNTAGQYTDPFYDAITGCTAKPNTDFCNTQLIAQNNSNPDLKPEKSKNFSVGFVFEPVQDLSLGVDYFKIKITNGITALTADDVLIDWFKFQTGPTTSSSVFANRLIIDPATGYLAYVNATQENVGKREVAGFDFSAKYRYRTGFGTFSPGWEATYLTKSTESNLVTGTDQNTLAQYVTEGPVPRLKQTVTLDWDQGPWAAEVRYFWQAGYRDYGDTRDVSPYELWDFQGQFKGVKNLTLTAGIRNVFDKKPPVSITEDYFQVGYDTTYADVRGRSYYLRANYRF